MTKDLPPFINSLICDFKNVQLQAKEDKKQQKHKTYKAWMANASSGFCGEAGRPSSKVQLHRTCGVGDRPLTLSSGAREGRG